MNELDKAKWLDLSNDNVKTQKKVKQSIDLLNYLIAHLPICDDPGCHLKFLVRSFFKGVKRS